MYNVEAYERVLDYYKDNKLGGLTVDSLLESMSKLESRGIFIEEKCRNCGSTKVSVLHGPCICDKCAQDLLERYQPPK